MSATPAQSSQLLEVGNATPFLLEELHFDEVLLDGAIMESALAQEFDLSTDVMRRLAAQAMAMMSVAVCSSSDAEFERFLDEFDAPPIIEEVAFMFGFAEHVRHSIVAAMAATRKQDELRLDIRRRIERAHVLCKQAVLQG